MTQEQKSQLERAMQIAKDHQHKVFTATHRATGATVYTVRSHSDPNMFHILYIQTGRIICDCYCSQQDRICSHSAAVRLFLIAQRDALASVEQAEQTPETPASVPETELQQALREQQEYNASNAEKQADFWKSWKSMECLTDNHARCLEGCPCTCACHESQDDYEQSKAPEGFTYDEYQAEQSITAGDLADAQSPERESGLEWDTGNHAESLPVDRQGWSRDARGMFLKV